MNTFTGMEFLSLALCLPMDRTQDRAQDRAADRTQDRGQGQGKGRTRGEGQGPASSETARKPSVPADNASIDALVQGLYEVISGPAGKKRDWARFRRLYHKDATLSMLHKDPKGRMVTTMLMPEDYIQRSGAWMEKHGLEERELARRVERYGHLVQVWSSYELTLGTGKKARKLRGINSIQCVQVEGGYKVWSILWEDQRTAGRIPARYLPDGKKL